MRAESRLRVADDPQTAIQASFRAPQLQTFIHVRPRPRPAMGEIGEKWDFAAVRLRRVERRLLSEADVQRSPDRHLGTSEAGPYAASQP